MRISLIGSGLRVLLVASVPLLGGCATSYVVPGPRADLQAFGTPTIQESFAEKATLPLPATLAFVRVQSPVYSSYEATKKADTRSTSWSTGEAADTTRRDNERAAFTQLLDQVEKTWPKLLERYARKS